ncbi:MAG TPA: hypothetical protein VIV54_18870 [Burkholderiales bacterium]
MDRGIENRARLAWRQQAALADAELRWIFGNMEAAAACWETVFDALAKEELRVLDRFCAATLPKKRPAKRKAAR